MRLSAELGLDESGNRINYTMPHQEFEVMELKHKLGNALQRIWTMIQNIDTVELKKMGRWTKLGQP